MNKIKSFFRLLVIHILNFFCSFFKIKKQIVLESFPDFSCNTYAIYEHFIKKGLNNKIKIYWLVDEICEKQKMPENVFLISRRAKGLFAKLKLYFFLNRSACIICCNRHIQKYKVSKKQLNIYIEHGSPLKDCSKFYTKFSCERIFPFAIITTAKISTRSEYAAVAFCQRWPNM